MVQLFSNVPWIYNEVGGNSAGQVGLSEADKVKYANGLIASVEKSVPLNATGSGSGSIVNASASTASSNCGGGGNFAAIAKSYTWPTYHDAPYCLPQDVYRTAVQAALDRIKAGKNDYVGGGSNTVPDNTEDCRTGGHAGIDCGGFVTRVFRDSGADPNYNPRSSNVVGQYAYVSSHPTLYQKVDITKSHGLQMGDIFFSQSLGHTYIFMGDQGHPGYNSVSASYSTTGRSWRTPMASNASNGDLDRGIWMRPLFPLSGAAATATGDTSTAT
jgi:hypothetical protein